MRASASAVLAIVAALLASWLSPFIPDGWAKVLGNEAVDEILQIVASSMLMVITFSLATMVTSYTTASQGVTPRATRLLMEDNQSQNALSIFMGAFIFSIVGIIALSTGYYGRQGRVILFGFVVVLIAMIVWTIIRWIEKLARLGRVHETIVKVEKKTYSSFKNLACNLTLGCRPYEDRQDGAFKVKINDAGYIQSIDYESLQEVAQKYDLKIYIEIATGNRVVSDIAVAQIVGSFKSEEKLEKAVRSCFEIGPYRLFEEDPRFGFVVLGEVASRALSSGVNDPGTAIEAISSILRLFMRWNNLSRSESDEIKFDRIYIKKFDPKVFFKDCIQPIARDGAANIEVVTSLYKALTAVESFGDVRLQEPASEYKELVIERAQQGLRYKDERALLNALLKT